MTKTTAARTIYDVVQHTFGNLPDNGKTPEGALPSRVIATCGTRALALGVIARNNSSFYRFEIVERLPSPSTRMSHKELLVLAEAHEIDPKKCYGTSKQALVMIIVRAIRGEAAQC